MTPEQATFLLHEVYLPQIHNESKATRRVIEAIPADKTGYQPDAKSKTAWDLASHIASAEVFFMLGVANGAFDRAAATVPETVKTPAALGAWYGENFGKAAAKLATTKPEDLTRVLTFAVFTLPAIQYVGVMINHGVHHRGQLATYLRPMGSKVPRIYGGSADEPMEAPQAAH